MLSLTPVRMSYCRLSLNVLLMKVSLFQDFVLVDRRTKILPWRDSGPSVVKDPGFSSSDTPKSKYEKLETRISECCVYLDFW